MEVSSVNLTFCGEFSEAIVKRVLNYAFSHNVQELNITCSTGKAVDLPLISSSQSLEHLTLGGYAYQHPIAGPPIWEQSALVTLNLHCVTLDDNCTDECAGLFSNCATLKNLTLMKCTLRSLNGFTICHPGLSSLTLKHGCKGTRVNVITPQLKNLTISNWRRIHLISTPNLSSLCYKDYDDDHVCRLGHFHYYDYDYQYDHAYYEYENDNDNEDDDDDEDDEDDDPLQLSTELSLLEKVDMCINCPVEYEDTAYAHKFFRLLQHLHSVKFLTLNLEFVKLLSSSVELISHQPSPFTNLKCLKIYPVYVTLDENTRPDVTMSVEVKNYLLNGSPGATFTMVSHEEIRAVKSLALARNLLGELQGILDEWKENSETKTAHMQQDKEPIESQMATVHEQVKVDDNRACIKSFWKDLNEQKEKGRVVTDRTISVLRKIKGLLTKVPASHQAKVQERFSCLYAEAGAMMDNMMERMKIQCDKKSL